MEMDLDGVRALCRLARLELGEGELRDMAAQLGPVMAYLGGLSRVDTQTPCEHGALDCALRPDIPAPSLDRAALLVCAPETDGAYILVPGVREVEI